MTAKWKEISAYTGRPVDEDAPTNAAGRGAVAGIGVGPDGEPGIHPNKKKKKALIDARSKSYKSHRAKLEAKRAKRAEQKNNFINKVKESTSEFNRESLIVEDNVDVLKSIVKTKSAKPVKFSDGTMKVDMTTASTMLQVLDKVNADNKEKLTRMINGKKGQFSAAANAVFKMVK
jgi:hypothetical protein|tara:strand:+ start:239 stop:763 length:525 start_codon:yes stop_codon:yes gene_type:complete